MAVVRVCPAYRVGSGETPSEASPGQTGRYTISSEAVFVLVPSPAELKLPLTLGRRYGTIVPTAGQLVALPSPGHANPASVL